MRKILLLVVLAAFTLSTQARKVMFRVNMSGVTVSANGVHIAGNFKDVNYDNIDENPTLVNWSPSAITLTDPDLDGIYSVVLDLKDSTAYEFKFINDNDWPGGENIPSASQVGGGNSNRWTYIKKTTATDTLMLDAVMFGGNAPTGMKLVRFKVNMKNQTVNADGVHVAGAFQGWNPAKSQMVNYTGSGGFGGTTYEFIGYVPNAGGTEFKFVNDNDWPGAESVPSACNVNGNRAISNINTDTVLTNFCFGSCEACPAAPIPTYNVTFRVDMSATCKFDSVDVAGGKINNWAGGTILRPISVGSSIHTVTVALDSGEIEYKFRILIGGKDPSWEGIANRIKAISSDTILTLVCFDKDTLCTPLPPTADVTFIVDLSNEIPDPNGDVYVMGNFTDPNWQNGAIKMTPVVGQIGMYQATFNMCPGTFAFKFTNGPANVGANEETFPNAADRGCVVNNGVGGFNRTYERTNGNPVTVGFVFNTCTTAVVTGIEKNQLAASSVSLFPNPTEENATVKFNDNSNISTVIVTDLAGRVIAEYKNVSDKNLNINTASFEAGIYFVSVMNENKETATVKLMVR